MQFIQKHRLSHELTYFGRLDKIQHTLLLETPIYVKVGLTGILNNSPNVISMATFKLRKTISCQHFWT